MRLSQPPVVKVDSNNSMIETLQEDFSMNIVRSRKQSMIGDFDCMSMSMKSSARFDSMPISERIWLPFSEKTVDVGLDLSRNLNYAYSESEQSASVREPLSVINKNKQTMFSDEESGVEADKKLLIIEDKKLLENYHFSEPNFSAPGTKVKNTSIANEYRKLKDVSKKLKKTYNNVLYVDEKFDDIEENLRKESRNANRTGQRSSASQRVVRQIAFPEDQKLFNEYCTFFKKNTDEMFDDQEMIHDMQEEMKVFFF